MPNISQEDIDAKAADLEKLREQVANAEAQRLERESQAAFEVTMNQLQTEEALLKARLATAKDASKVATVKEGVAAPLDEAKEHLKRAVAQQKAAESSGKDSSRATESEGTGANSGDAAAKSSGGSTGKDAK